MAPEMLFLTATGVALIGAARAQGQWPDGGLKAVVAGAVLVVFASAMAGTQLEPLAKAFGWLTLIAAIYGAVRASRSSTRSGASITTTTGRKVNAGVARVGSPAIT
jgi:hypothetical protein